MISIQAYSFVLGRKGFKEDCSTTIKWLGFRDPVRIAKPPPHVSKKATAGISISRSEIAFSGFPN